MAGGLTVSGDYAQSAQGELVLRDGPLKVTGGVRLAGDLDLATAATAPASPRRITVLDHRGRAKTTGTFTGLKEGENLQLDDTTYRISHRGGDGNDVVLTAVTGGPSPTSDRPRTAADTLASPAPRTTSTAASGLGWWPYVLSAGLLVGLAVPATRFGRGRRRRRGGRHAA
ncbi:hypothetical protein AB5J55_33355 [Streptomyces sp. R11]|uniref:Uncharacterized protein n=1 Tax=Streptomyces sp. R11 TaxID=3238625 RepID=A0AB39N9N0_9ACTN